MWNQPALCFIFLTHASSFVITNYFWRNRFCPKNRLLCGAFLWSQTNALHLQSNKISLKIINILSWKFWRFCQCEKLCMYVSWTMGKVYYLLELRWSCCANRTGARIWCARSSRKFILRLARSEKCSSRHQHKQNAIECVGFKTACVGVVFSLFGFADRVTGEKER